MPVPKVVLFVAFGRTLPALVLAAREGEVSHLGSNREPALTLAVLDPARETGLTPVKDEDGKKTGEFIYPAGRLPQVFIEHDVVHESHEFDDKFWETRRVSKPTAADVASMRGHGEWREFDGDGEAATTILRLRGTISRVASERDESRTQAGREKARADKAEADLKLSVAVAEALQKRIDAIAVEKGESTSGQ